MLLRPFNLILTILKRKLFRLKHSLSYTLWFTKDAQYNLQQTSVTSTRVACRPFFLPLSPLFSLNSPHSFVSPLSLFASAPPYNHASSWLSFGVVYIAVIVRVQYRDWAEHVYSLTGLFCNKSGEERIEVERGGYVRARKHLHTHKDTFTYTQCSNNTVST